MNSCRLLLWRFSAGEFPPQVSFPVGKGFVFPGMTAEMRNGEYNPKRTHFLQAGIKGQTGFPGSAKKKKLGHRKIGSNYRFQWL
jgi:hypothetical protein